MGKATPQPAKVPKFTPVNIPDAISQALSYDTQGYDASDALFAAEYPGLVQARKNEMQDALKQLTGPLDPTLQNQFTQQGLEAALTATGGGNVMAGVETDSLGGNTASNVISKDVLDKRAYDTDFVNQLIAQNPLRSFGLTGADVAQLAIFNTRQGNIANLANYNNQIASINAQGAASAANWAGIAGIGSAIAGLSTQLFSPSYIGGPSGTG